MLILVLFEEEGAAVRAFAAAFAFGFASSFFLEAFFAAADGWPDLDLGAALALGLEAFADARAARSAFLLITSAISLSS